MIRLRTIVVVMLASGLGSVAAAGCSTDDVTSPTVRRTDHSATTTPSPSPSDWTSPGLVDRDGETYAVPSPPPATGAVLDATDFGADPAPDSADDAAAVRAAVAAAEPGDTVLLPAGTYDLRSADPSDATTNVRLRTDIDLLGAGSTKTVLRSAFDGEDDTAVLRGKAIEDVRVSGLSLTSTYTGPLGTDSQDDDAGGGVMFGLQLGEEGGRGSARILVEDVAVTRFQRHGITVKASREVTIRHCHVSDATSLGAGGSGYGIAIEGRADQREPDAGNDSRHNVVIANTLKGPHLRHAILLQFATHNNLVADNDIDGSVLDAIDLHGEGEYLNEIRDNTVTGGQRAAIALGNSGGEIHAHGASGEGNWIHDNSLTDNQTGILVILGTPDTLVEDNTIDGGDEGAVGIELDDAPGTVLRRNTIGANAADFVPQLGP